MELLLLLLLLFAFNLGDLLRQLRALNLVARLDQFLFALQRFQQAQLLGDQLAIVLTIALIGSLHHTICHLCHNQIACCFNDLTLIAHVRDGSSSGQSRRRRSVIAADNRIVKLLLLRCQLLLLR